MRGEWHSLSSVVDGCEFVRCEFILSMFTRNTFEMDWSKGKCFELIEEYKKAELLWDGKNEFYFSKSKKEDTWRAIAQKFKVSTEEVKKKMASLLGSFRRERSKLRSSINDGSTDVYKSNWFGFNHLTFLLDRSDPVRTYLPEDTNTNDLDSGSGDFPKNDPLDDSFFQCSPLETRRKRRKTKIKRKKVTPEDSQINKALKMFKNSYTPDTDYCTVFGRHIGNKLRSYSKNTRIYVEHIINTTLFEADIGKYNNYTPPDLQSHSSVNPSGFNNVINSTTPFAFTLPGSTATDALSSASVNQYNTNRPCTSISSNPLIIEADDVKLQTDLPPYT